MEETSNIQLGSTKRFSDQELKIWIALQQFQAYSNTAKSPKTEICQEEYKFSVLRENQHLRILLSCRICRENRIRCVLQCGHLTCWNCSEKLVNCSFCGTAIRNRYPIYLHPPY